MMMNFVIKLNIVHTKTIVLPGKMYNKCMKNLIKKKQFFFLRYINKNQTHHLLNI